MDRLLAAKRARDARAEADALRRKEPGHGSHRYRGDPYPVVALDQLAERYDLAAAEVTLDGQPAKIIGVRNSFATVQSRDGRLSAEWAWSTAALIVAERGGAFRL